MEFQKYDVKEKKKEKKERKKRTNKNKQGRENYKESTGTKLITNTRKQKKKEIIGWIADVHAQNHTAHRFLTTVKGSKTGRSY